MKNSIFNTAYAQDGRNATQVDVLNQIVPTTGFNAQNQNDPFSLILNQIFYAGLVVAVALAVLMIVRGGIQYMTTDSVDGKGGAKLRIQAAVGGLVLAFASILILNTINPSLTRTDLTIEPVNISAGNAPGLEGNANTVTSGTRPSDPNNPNNQAITPTGEGFTTTPGRVAIDTDGSNPPPFTDPDYQNQTSKGGLDANVDNYVVVPIGSDIPLGTRVMMYNEDTQKTVWGIVGDRGPTANGYGELSLNAARELGAWTDGMGNSAKQHKITYTYYTNEN